jgi:hypothetical protein
MVYHQRIYTPIILQYSSHVNLQVSTSPAQLFIERCKAETNLHFPMLKRQGSVDDALPREWQSEAPLQVLPTRFRLSGSVRCVIEAAPTWVRIRVFVSNFEFDPRCVYDPRSRTYIRPDTQHVIMDAYNLW